MMIVNIFFVTIGIVIGAYAMHRFSFRRLLLFYKNKVNRYCEESSAFLEGQWDAYAYCSEIVGKRNAESLTGLIICRVESLADKIEEKEQRSDDLASNDTLTAFKESRERDLG